MIDIEKIRILFCQICFGKEMMVIFAICLFQPIITDVYKRTVIK